MFMYKITLLLVLMYLFGKLPYGHPLIYNDQFCLELNGKTTIHYFANIYKIKNYRSFF